MSRFTIGQKLRCINPANPRHKDEDGGGGGWVEGITMIVRKITREDIHPIYWPGTGGAGVYEDFLEPAEEWDTEGNHE